ncbi:MAG: hypothetical protein Q8O31_06430 [Rhodocyclaceae bacterium]|nr:hypothetical protein [Rhodocyclaceae bacterium]
MRLSTDKQNHMQYADIIAMEIQSFTYERQAEVLDFVEFLKVKQSRTLDTSTPKTVEEIEAFFRSFNVDTNGYKFDREEANAR